MRIRETQGVRSRLATEDKEKQSPRIVTIILVLSRCLVAIVIVIWIRIHAFIYISYFLFPISIP